MSKGTKSWRLMDLKYGVRSGTNQILSDASKASGGEETGLNPHELLEGSLAACTAMTMQMYANRKEWPLKNANVIVKILEEGKQSVLERTIELIGDLSKEQKDRLIEIADKCPIHKILTGQVTIHTKSV
ncbi:MAG: OsmC family protein [Bdellovibrionales bacterium]|nr:OsmC family protein [Bdellovibrionales bacterium]